MCVCDSDLRSHQAVSQRHQEEGLHHRDHGGLLRLPGHCGRSGCRRRHRLHLRGAVWHPGPAGQRHCLMYLVMQYTLIYIFLNFMFPSVPHCLWLDVSGVCRRPRLCQLLITSELHHSFHDRQIPSTQIRSGWLEASLFMLLLSHCVRLKLCLIHYYFIYLFKSNCIQKLFNPSMPQCWRKNVY